MKHLCANIAFVTALLIAVSATAQKKSDVSRDQLIGPVHTAQIELAEVAVKDGKEVEIWRRPHQKVVYDQRGNEIERINFNQSGSIENRTVHVIDANGRVSGWKEYEVDTGGSSERVTNWSEWLYFRSYPKATPTMFDVSPSAVNTPPLSPRPVRLRVDCALA